jgi:cobalamin biosynthesis Mg chelatase CobN
MRFRRSQPPVVIDEAPALLRTGESHPPAEFFPLSAVPLREFMLEGRRRGLMVAPRSAWERLASQLEAAEAHAAAAAEREASRVDMTEQVRVVSKIARKDFPAAVEEIGDLQRENTDLEGRVRRAETEVSVLAQAIVGPEIDALERGAHNDNGEDPNG